MRPTRLELPLALLLALAAPAAAQAPGLALEFKDVPGCVAEAAGLCAAGHDPGAEEGLQDDTFRFHTVIVRAHVEAPAVPGAPPAAVRVDHDETYVEHPVFRTAEWVFIRVNGTLPPEVTRHAELHAGPNAHGTDGLWVRWRPYSVVPLGDPAWTTGIGFPYYNPVERDRWYPIPGDLGPDGFDTDEGLGFAADLSRVCFPEVALLAPSACEAEALLVPLATAAAMAALPNVSLDAGVQHVAVATGPSLVAASKAPSLAAGADAPEAEGTPGRASPSPGTDLRTVVGAEPFAAAPRLASGAPAGPSPLAPRSLASGEAAGDLVLWAVAGGAGLLLAWALYRRLRRASLLEHPARKALLELVTANPGITIGRAAQVLGNDYKTVQHHADLLVSDGHLSVHLNGRQRCMFLNAQPYTNAARAALLVRQRPVAHRFLEALGQGPLPRRELLLKVPVGRTAAWRALRALQEHGWVEVVPAAGGGLVAATRKWPPGAPGGPGSPARGEG